MRSDSSPPWRGRGILAIFEINASSKGNSLKRIKFKIFKVFEAEAELVNIKEKEETDAPTSVSSKELE